MRTVEDMETVIEKCGICGDRHAPTECEIIDIKLHVSN